MELVLEAVLVNFRVVLGVICGGTSTEIVVDDRSQLAVARSWHSATLEGFNATIAEAFRQRVLLPVLLLWTALGTH